MYMFTYGSVCIGDAYQYDKLSASLFTVIFSLPVICGIWAVYAIVYVE